MGKKKQKKKISVNWLDLTLTALTDITVGIILILIDKMIG